MKIRINNEAVYQGSLILINGEYALKYEKNEIREFENAGCSVPLDSTAADILDEIFAEINCGSRIVPVSGYRSFGEQTEIFDGSMQENGEEYTRKFVALPGHSEHQTGLAIDLGLNEGEIDFICPHFPYDGVCGKFRAEAVQRGFIERYPAGAEKITGIAHEPWHFRYTGLPHSLYIGNNGITFEEYISLVRSYTVDSPLIINTDKAEYSVFFVKAENREFTEIYLPENSSYVISGNNADGFIVTLKNI